jgi:hypothetical protein
VSLQDQLRAENLEVADTGSLLTQAADQIDTLESQAVTDAATIADLQAQIGPKDARIAELEGVLFQVRDLAVGAIGAV